MQIVRSGDFQTIGDLVRELVRRRRWSTKLIQARLTSCWEEIVGAPIARHTTSIFLRKKKLYLRFDSPALRQELHYSQEQLRTRLNEELGDEVISEIVLL